MLVAITYEEHGELYAAINSNVTGSSRERFGAPLHAIGRPVEPAAKTERWKQLWFRGVVIEEAAR